MTIREYFDLIPEDERDEMEYTMYQISQDDPEDFESWAIENGIDLTAAGIVINGYEISALTLWGWDMCGD